MINTIKKITLGNFQNWVQVEAPVLSKSLIYL